MRINRQLKTIAVLSALALGTAAPASSLSEGNWHEICRLFHVPGQAPVFRVATQDAELKQAQEVQDTAPESAQVVYDKVLPFTNILNQHYASPFTKTLGKDKVAYAITGQEEKPKGIALYGTLTLIVASSTQQTPPFAEISAIEGRGNAKAFLLGGSVYHIYHEKTGLRPDLGKIHLLPQEQGLESHSILIGDMLKAVYKTSKPLDKTPIRLGFFNKLSSLQNPKAKPEYWLMLLKDGMDNDEFIDDAHNRGGGGLSKFRRIHVDSASLPVNPWPIPEGKSWTWHTVKFEDHYVEMALVEASKKNSEEKEMHLHLRISK